MTAPAVLPVAAAQAESVSGDVAANVATAAGLVAEAAGDGARLVVLPELFLTGYDPDGWADETCLDDEAVTGDARLDPLREASREHGAVVVAGAAVRVRRDGAGAAGAPYRRTISLLAFDRQGTACRVYDKQHLVEVEQGFFSAGDHGASLVVDGWELGLGVCYDGCFPEHATAAAADGATAYLCPAAYYAGAAHRRDLYYAARALDNGIYVVLSGLTGSCGSHTFGGGSAVYDPEGRALARAAEQGRALVHAALDPAEVARVQKENPLARDRRPDLGQRRRRVLGG